MTRPAASVEWSLRPMRHADLGSLLAVQERGAVVALAGVFPQAEHPFPVREIHDRWARELVDPAIDAYVAVDRDARILGFAARRADEVLHFGTAPETWGTGLAAELHDALVARFPPGARPRLWVFEGNRRARRFYERLGWTATGADTVTSYPPNPRLLEYALDRPRGQVE